MIFYFYGHTTWLGDLSSLAMDQTHAPAMEAWRLNNWATKEVPSYSDFYSSEIPQAVGNNHSVDYDTAFKNDGVEDTY